MIVELQTQSGQFVYVNIDAVSRIQPSNGGVCTLYLCGGYSVVVKGEAKDLSQTLNKEFAFMTQLP